MTENVQQYFEEVSDCKTLANFVEALRQDMAAHTDAYENATLDSYLEALAAFSRDYDGYCLNHGLDESTPTTWKTVASLIYAAGVYE